MDRIEAGGAVGPANARVHDEVEALSGSATAELHQLAEEALARAKAERRAKRKKIRKPILADVERRIENEHDQDQGPRRQIAKALRLLIDCQRLYKTTDAHGKRLANQTFTTGIDIDEDEEATLRLVEPFAIASTCCARSTSGENTHVRGSTTSKIVDLRREFENPCPALRTVSSRRSRGVYQRDRRPLGPSVVDERGRMVRAVGMTQTFLSPAQVDELVTLYQEGATLVELGERFSVHRRTAAAHLVRRAVPIRRRGLDECHIAEAVELYISGLTLMEVGRRFGVSQQAVRRALVAAGAAIRPSGRRAQVSA